MQLLCQEYLLDFLSRRKKLAPEKSRPRLIHGYRNDSIQRPPSNVFLIIRGPFPYNYNAPINVMPAGGEAGQGVGI